MKVKKKMKLSALNSSGINKEDDKSKKFLKIVTNRKKHEALAGETATPRESAKMQEVHTKKKKKKKQIKADVIQANEGTLTGVLNRCKEKEFNETDMQAMGEEINHESTNKNRKLKKKAQGNRVEANIKSEEPENIKTSESTNNVELNAAKDKKEEKKKKMKKYVLFLGNLPYELEEGEVEEHFEVVKASIKRVTILTDKVTGLGRGCGFIELTTPQAYQAAFKLNLSKLKEHKIRVEFTTPGKKSTNRNKWINMKTRKILGQSKRGKKKRNNKWKNM